MNTNILTLLSLFVIAVGCIDIDVHPEPEPDSFGDENIDTAEPDESVTEDSGDGYETSGCEVMPDIQDDTCEWHPGSIGCPCQIGTASPCDDLLVCRDGFCGPCPAGQIGCVCDADIGCDTGICVGGVCS